LTDSDRERHRMEMKTVCWYRWIMWLVLSLKMFVLFSFL